jgi:uncharacterized membrane protein
VKGANRLMAVLFGIAAALQYNDPDPFRWMAIYGLAGLACLLALAGRLPRTAAVVIGLAALVWAATLAPGVVGRVSFWELFESLAMKSEPVEEAREMGGLFLVAAWMAVLALRGAPAHR